MLGAGHVRGIRIIELKTETPAAVNKTSQSTNAADTVFKMPTNKARLDRGASGWFVDFLCFLFSDGSKTPLYGGTGGDLNYPLQLARNPGGQLRGRLMGFWDSSTQLLVQAFK